MEISSEKNLENFNKIPKIHRIVKFAQFSKGSLIFAGIEDNKHRYLIIDPNTLKSTEIDLLIDYYSIEKIFTIEKNNFIHFFVLSTNGLLIDLQITAFMEDLGPNSSNLQIVKNSYNIKPEYIKNMEIVENEFIKVLPNEDINAKVKETLFRTMDSSGFIVNIHILPNLDVKYQKFDKNIKECDFSILGKTNPLCIIFARSRINTYNIDPNNLEIRLDKHFELKIVDLVERVKEVSFFSKNKNFFMIKEKNNLSGNYRYMIVSIFGGFKHMNDKLGFFNIENDHVISFHHNCKFSKVIANYDLMTFVLFFGVRSQHSCYPVYLSPSLGVISLDEIDPLDMEALEAKDKKINSIILQENDLQIKNYEIKDLEITCKVYGESKDKRNPLIQFLSIFGNTSKDKILKNEYYKFSIKFEDKNILLIILLVFLILGLIIIALACFIFLVLRKLGLEIDERREIVNNEDNDNDNDRKKFEPRIGKFFLIKEIEEKIKNKDFEENKQKVFLKRNKEDLQRNTAGIKYLEQAESNFEDDFVDDDEI